MTKVTTEGLVRRCKPCGVEYPLTTKYFHQNPTLPYGFGYYCKFCFNDYRHGVNARKMRREIKQLWG